MSLGDSHHDSLLTSDVPQLSQATHARQEFTSSWGIEALANEVSRRASLYQQRSNRRFLGLCSKELQRGLHLLYRMVTTMERSGITPGDPEHLLIVLKVRHVIRSSVTVLDSLSLFKALPSILSEDGCPGPRVVVIAQSFLRASGIGHFEPEWRRYLSLVRLRPELTYQELSLL